MAASPVPASRVRPPAAWIVAALVVLGALWLPSGAPATNVQTEEGGWATAMRWSDWHDLQAQVRELYQLRGFEPLWIDGAAATPQALRIAGLLEGAGAYGLSGGDYEVTRWRDTLAQLHVLSAAEQGAELELALTVNLMRFLDDLHGGRAQARRAVAPKELASKSLKLSARVQELAGAKDLDQELVRQVEPAVPEYQRLKRALVRYQELAQAEDVPGIPVVKLLEPGDTYAGVAPLARLLRRLGDLGPQHLEPIDPLVYEGNLVAAVARFQRRHGLDVDGRIGPETFRTLNTPLSQRVSQLQLALERWRWLTIERDRDSIVVNIPEFRLRAFNRSGELALEMDVVVGMARSSETPVFADQMQTVVLRPSWYVPTSIARSDVVPRLAEDPDYLADHGFVIGGARSAELSEEVLEGLRLGSLKLRQRPGPRNALGRVKFLFPNRFHVYLHDTPQTKLFEKTRRDFSHGCIRVANPEALAVWALRNQPEWSEQRLLEAMHNGPMEQAVTIAEPIPIVIVYLTAGVREDGTVLFFRDIYRQDERLLEALQSPQATPVEAADV